MINFFFKLFFISLLILSGFILFLGLNDYNLYYKGKIRTILYFFVPLIIFIISILSIFTSSNKRNFIGFNLLIPIIMFYSYEVYLMNKSERKAYSEFPNFKSDVYKFYAPGINLLNNSFFKYEGILPLTGVSSITTIFCNEGCYFSKYKSDQYGFNNKNSLNPDIALLGDSFTHGACVMPEENLASNLEKLTSLNVTNYGMSGIGPLTILAILKEYVSYKKPKKVFWMHYEGNDLHDLAVESENLILKNYLNLDYTQNLTNKTKEIDNILLKTYEQNFNFSIEAKEKKDVKKLFSKKILLETLKLTKIRIKLGLAFGPGSFNENEFKNILEQAKNIVNTWQGELVFFYLPANQRKQGNIFSRSGWDYSKKKVEKVINELNIKMIDLSFILEGRKTEKYFYYPESHFNPEGYSLLANQIVRKLELLN